MRAALAALALILGIAGPAAAQVVELDATGLRNLAYTALQAGFAQAALDYCDALLARDPQDATALILKARALRLLQRYPESEAAARAGVAAAEVPSTRFAAAMTLAQALSLQNQRTAAQYWLRQAAEAAPTPAARRQAERDFAFVKSQNPLSFRIDTVLKPSSNVNGGAADPIFEFLGLPFVLSGDALALSGLQGSLGISGSYILDRSQTSRSELRFTGLNQFVVLSDAAQVQAPDATNADYAYQVVELGFSQRRALGARGMSGSAGMALGHNWYGGADLSNYVRLEMGLERPFSRQMTGYASLTGEAQTRLDTPLASADVVTFSLGVAQVLRGGDRLRTTVGVRQTTSDDPGVDHQALTAGLDWTRAKPLIGMAISGAFDFEARDYPVSLYTTSGRQDQKFSLTLSAELRQIDYLGFSPVISLTAARNISNVALYTSETLGIGLSIASRF